MKNKTKQALCLPFMLLLTGMSFTGCSGVAEEPEKVLKTGDSITPLLTEIQMPYELEIKEGWEYPVNNYEVCYSDDEVMIVANTYRDLYTPYSVIHPEPRTDGVYVVNYNEPSSYTHLDIESDSTVYSAVPYKDGIIYAQTKLVDEKTHVDNTVQYLWSILYFDGTKSEIIDSGYGKNLCTAQLTLLEDIPVYTCERSTESSVNMEIRKIVDLKPETIETLPDHENFTYSICSNGTSYFAQFYNEESKDTVIVGNAEKVYLKRTFDEGFNSGCLTKEHLICSVGLDDDDDGENDDSNIKLIKIALDSPHDETVIPLEQRLWRMNCSQGRYITAFHESSKPCYIDTEAGVIGEIAIDEEIALAITYPNFYPAGKNRYILPSNLNTVNFYLADFT